MEPAELLLLQMRVAGVPEPKTEWQFAADFGRKFRFDFCWPNKKIALEFEGGSWSGGGHTRGKHFESDLVKYAIAQLLGWHVLRVNNHMVDDGRALILVEGALGMQDCSDVALTLSRHRCDQCLTKAEKLKRMAKNGHD